MEANDLFDWMTKNATGLVTPVPDIYPSILREGHIIGSTGKPSYVVTGSGWTEGGNLVVPIIYTDGGTSLREWESDHYAIPVIGVVPGSEADDAS